MCNNVRRDMEYIGKPHKRKYRLNARGRNLVFYASMTIGTIMLVIMSMLMTSGNYNAKLLLPAIVCIASLCLSIKYRED